MMDASKYQIGYGHTYTYTDVDMGGCAIDKYGDPLLEAELQKCLASKF